MHRSTLNTEGMSTASIKSGVLGFPQDGESHAAMGNLPGERGLDATQAETSSELPDRTLHHKRDSPDLSKDSAFGAATTGTAAGLGARELSGRHEEDKPVQQSHALASDRTADRVAEPTHQQSSQGPNVIGDTDRTFPLMGGVTSRKEADPITTTTHSSSKPTSTHPEPVGLPSSAAEPKSNYASINPPSTGLTSTSEREPGTKDRDVALGDGREALAGAAAAGVATTAASSAKKSEHEHGGHGHNYDGPRYIDEKEKPNAGLVFTQGPHVTDTANLVDPHLHIPGEFPDPTPIEESSQPSFGAGGATSGFGSTSRQGDTTPSAASGKPTQEHHYGRDAALAGGAGAAGLGAYEAGKHHQRESTDIANEPAIGSSTNPYSSQKLDPRVDSTPRRFEEKRSDPIVSSSQAKDNHSGRDAALVGGTAGAVGLGGYEASTHRPQEQENIQPSSTLPQTNQGISQTTPSTQQQTATQGLPETTEPSKPEHHYGRDATVVGGLGAAGAGAYAYSQREEKDAGPAPSTIGPHKSNVANVVDPRVQPDPALQKHHQAGATPEDPASATVGPHKSNIANVLDPRVQPEPEKQKGHTTTGPHQSDTLNRLDPKADQKTQPESQHHYGRDAAVVGGTGAAGYGAYEAAEKYDQHRSTQPGAAMEEQRYDPTAKGAHDPSQTEQHHYGRDAAAVGGLGAAGAGAYAYSQRHEGTQPQSTQAYQQPSTTTQPYSSQQTAQGYQPSATQQFSSTQPAAGHQRYDSAQEPREQQHNKRDAAAVAGAGTAGAGVAHEYNKHEAEKAQKEQLAQQQKEFEKKQKQQDHDFKHQQKELEKQQANDKKEHEKLVAAEEKKHHKEVEKKEAQQQKEMDKEKENEGKEKKHHLFGFLHRDKSKKEEAGEPQSPTRASKESPRTSKEYAGLGAAGAAGVGTTAAAYEAGHDSDSDGRKERNRLHKDPPKGHPAREALEHQHEHGGPGIHQHVGIDGPINRPGEISGDHETRHNVYGAHPIDDQKHLVTEPHTGLPMNAEKYGDGHGGTDASQTVSGYHQGPGASNQTGATGATDWDAIKKANTPY
ncbi:hypothetical protein BDV96DRAFT_321749 [Lophiotrema nucula]|uniref:Uncharacterized protein n=1 Tax=Lophiotrema nucula TaxID=690887 RepID=A0A6A5ZLJ5_9PLEO|nr:hypothetical protein BDV96DRAFT_321749 [Lophiotrema nucula]